MKNIQIFGGNVKKFNPVSLFKNGEQGVWYDPSDIKNYMATGPSLVLNSDFSDGLTNWDVSNATAVVNNGIVTITNTGVRGLITQSIPTIIGKRYIVEFEIIEPGTGISVTPFNTSDGIGYYYPQLPGIYRLIFTASSIITSIRLVAGANIGDNGSFNFVTTKELINVTNATMFQDITGTIPVTGVEQPVGLILDKSRLARGPELLSNGDFSSGATGWSIPAGWALTGSTCTATAAAGSLRQIATPYIAGKFYEVTFDWTHTSGLLYVRVGLSTAVTFNTSGRKRAIFMATATTGIEFYGGAVSGVVDNISIKEVYGNHAYQTTAIDRPILRNRYNLFTESEFRNGLVDAPIRGGLVSESTLGGYSKAIAFGYDGATASYAYKAPLTGVIGTTYTLSVVVSMTNGLSPIFGSSINDNILNDFCIVIAGAAVTPTLYRINNLGNNNYSVTATYPATMGSPNFGIVKYATNSSRTFKVTAYHLETGTEIKYYQKIDTATVYDSDYSKFPVYLACNGTNTWMKTNNFDLSASQYLSLFMNIGIKTSTPMQIVCEHSAAYSVSNGAFELSLNEVTAGGLAFARRGTTQNIYKYELTKTTPRNVILSGIININDSTPANVIMRTNYTANSSSGGGGAGSTGPGGNYPLYLFRRGGTTAAFNGDFYGLIIRGANETTKQISDIEKYLYKKSRIIG